MCAPFSRGLGRKLCIFGPLTLHALQGQAGGRVEESTQTARGRRGAQQGGRELAHVWQVAHKDLNLFDSLLKNPLKNPLKIS